MLNALIGTKFKIVSGYTATPDVLIAMQRGEVHGLADFAWGNVKRRPDLQLKVLMQSGLSKSPDLPDVPLALDFVKNEEDRKVMELFFVQKTVARPLVAPPDIPRERLAALRDAFIAMTKDAAFLAETEKLSIDVEPERGERWTSSSRASLRRQRTSRRDSRRSLRRSLVIAAPSLPTRRCAAIT